MYPDFYEFLGRKRHIALLSKIHMSAVFSFYKTELKRQWLFTATSLIAEKRFLLNTKRRVKKLLAKMTGS